MQHSKPASDIEQVPGNRIANPGSDAAIADGCRCPRMDNSYGRGYYCQEGVFVYTQGCPLHWPEGQVQPVGADL